MRMPGAPRIPGPFEFLFGLVYKFWYKVKRFGSKTFWFIVTVLGILTLLYIGEQHYWFSSAYYAAGDTIGNIGRDGIDEVSNIDGYGIIESVKDFFVEIYYYILDAIDQAQNGGGDHYGEY
jgi:hypothetical protein